MAGEIQLNSTTMATESSGTITLSNVNSATNRTNLGLGSMATQNANAVALTGGSITGITIVPTTPFSFRNRIINGNLSNPINQRGAGSITASTGYNYDRWYYDGSTYLYQGIEDKNVNNGTYVISWEGSGINAAWKVSTDTTAGNGPDATTGFTSISNGGTFTVNEGTEYSKHLWIRFDGTLANLDKVQVEEGTVATPFEHRPYGTELALCQRYYHRYINGNQQSIGIGHWWISSAIDTSVTFPVAMRSAPTLVATSGSNYYYILTAGSVRYISGAFSIGRASTNAAQLSASPDVGDTAGRAGLVASTSASSSIAFDAEL
jgi:hypothetical protein